MDPFTNPHAYNQYRSQQRPAPGYALTPYPPLRSYPPPRSYPAAGTPYPPPPALQPWPAGYPPPQPGYGTPHYSPAPPPPQPRRQQEKMVVDNASPQQQPQSVGSYNRHIIFAGLVIGFFLPLGLIAFYLAVKASGMAVSDRARARKLGRTSIGLSVAGIILFVITVLIFVFLVVGIIPFPIYCVVQSSSDAFA